MIDTHAEIALNFGIAIAVAATESVKSDMMGSTLLCMELQTKACNSRDMIRNSGGGREGDSPNDNRRHRRIIEAKNSTARCERRW